MNFKISLSNFCKNNPAAALNAFYQQISVGHIDNLIILTLLTLNMTCFAVYLPSLTFPRMFQLSSHVLLLTSILNILFDAIVMQLFSLLPFYILHC